MDGIPVSVVLSYKNISKVANHVAKSIKKGVLMKSSKTIKEVLKYIPVDELWGVGRQYAKFLMERGFHTAHDLAHGSESWIKA